MLRVLIFFLFCSFAHSSYFFEDLAEDRSYYFTLQENEEEVSGWLTKKDTSYHWKPVDELEPELWLREDSVLILDRELETTTYWNLKDFEQLHPFVSAWYWLSNIDKFNKLDKPGSASLCSQEHGCFALKWTYKNKLVNWNNQEVIFQLDLHHSKASTFDFVLPKSWVMEYH